jgi:3-methyladenine DNA glycosylase Tag
MIGCCSNITIMSGGVPTHDDRKHFEILVLSGAQPGLN